MAGSAITAAAASRTFFIQYLLVEEFQRGASRRTELRKRGNSTRRFLHSPPNGAFADALLPKCGPDVTVPPGLEAKFSFWRRFSTVPALQLQKLPGLAGPPCGQIVP